jgi:CheY-like chemotaxis protein
VRMPAVPAVGVRSVLGDEPRARASQRRVLIVEDNRDAREMFRMMLELDGHQVIEAEEGCAGLELLRTGAPDVAFIDVGLPGLDGYEIARRFRAEGGAGNDRVLLVALTGYGTPDALERSRRAGFDHHLIKPVNPDALYRLLSSHEEPAPAGVAASEGRLYNGRLNWCGVEQSGSSSGS